MVVEGFVYVEIVATATHAGTAEVPGVFCPCSSAQGPVGSTYCSYPLKVSASYLKLAQRCLVGAAVSEL